jgi:hypothetical protein
MEKWVHGSTFDSASGMHSVRLSARSNSSLQDQHMAEGAWEKMSSPAELQPMTMSGAIHHHREVRSSTMDAKGNWYWNAYVQGSQPTL